MPPLPALPPRAAWNELLERALAEDIGDGDITGNLLFARDARSSARIEAREPLLLCGLSIAEACFQRVDERVQFKAHAEDGGCLQRGAVIAEVHGCTRSLLAAERTALNFLARLSGIAGYTARFVAAAAGAAQIYDTRKTLPGFRVLDKYAVAVGGGNNHRFGLYDAILIKDNHIQAAGGVEAAVKTARDGMEAAARTARDGAQGRFEIQVEVETPEQALAALRGGADLLLLDNRSPEELREFSALLAGRVPLEASGGVTLENVAEVAATGVERISIGALTHSAPAADVALEFLQEAGSER